MNEDIVKRITFPKWWKGVQQNHVGCPKKIYLHAFDTETVLGRVFLTGFYDRRGYTSVYGFEKDHAGAFFEYLSGFNGGKRKNYTHIVGAHNLKYDLGVLLWQMLNPLGKAYPSQKESRFCHLPTKAEVFIAWRRPCFMKVRFRGRVSVTVVDTFAYFPTSLKRILQMIGGEDQKLETPEKIGLRIIPKKEIVPYNKADNIGVYRILEFIEARHRQFDVRFSISLPQLSSRIFRHKFLERPFVVPPKEALWGALYAYHGGKNTWTGKPGWHNAYDLDIKSAFPHAMLNMPDFSDGKWVKSSKICGDLPGFYLVAGNTSNCNWGSLFSHAFKKISGEFEPTWVTSYELNEALRSRELPNYRVVDGYVFTGRERGSPFKKFVDHFFKSKEEAKTKIEREFFKLILNSLYGKFIQKTEDEQTGDFKIGGLFDPCVASLITGFVRARIHRLEHKYNALHTATDGILTLRKPDPVDLGENLGDLTCGNFGPCLVIRNKLYLHYDVGGNLKKRGLHGFQGKPDELLKLWQEKRKYYKISRLTSWAESWRMGLPPGGPMEREMILGAIK